MRITEQIEELRNILRREYIEKFQGRNINLISEKVDEILKTAPQKAPYYNVFKNIKKIIYILNCENVFYQVWLALNDAENALLSEDIQFVKGIGPRRASLLKKREITSVYDLITYFPRAYQDRRSMRKIINLSERNEIYTVFGKIIYSGFKKLYKRRGKIFSAIIDDDTGRLVITFFNAMDYLADIIKPGKYILATGKLNYYQGKNFINPDYQVFDESAIDDSTLRIIPIYSEIENLSSKQIGGLVENVLSIYGPVISEIIPRPLLKKRKLLGLSDAVRCLHFPENFNALKKAENTYAYYEFFLIQFSVVLKNYLNKSKKGIKFNITKKMFNDINKLIPFKLTAGQMSALRIIAADFMSGSKLNRLLQGDVGCGKTAVALISAYFVFKNGFQTAFMAPTEILAVQQYLSSKDILNALSVKSACLTGKMNAAQKRELKEKLLSGEINVVFGTHALIQKDVEFKKLGFIVIDEQHKFGVEQRYNLYGKGDEPHMLVMTATPIPRTLTLTVYGDMDTVFIKEKPPGRKEIKTIAYGEAASNYKKAFDFVREEINKGNQAYFVYPLIEESEALDLKSVIKNYEYLKENDFKGYKTGLIHGRMKSDEKEKVMDDFKNKKFSLLFSTTVIEVGIDIKDATVMVIFHANRFGAAQLHQLRGRIGRSHKDSYCVLFYDGKASPEAKIKLNALCETADGFKISEIDLQLRGQGEFFGTRQHGMPELKKADIFKHGDLIIAARRDAEEIFRKYRYGTTAYPYNLILNHIKFIHGEKSKLLDI